MVCSVAAAVAATSPRAQVTRTALHVARSLDPDATETVNVRTRTGDIATLIVRKRDGKSNLVLPPAVSVRSSSINVREEEENREAKSMDNAPLNVPAPAAVRSSEFLVEGGDSQRSGKSTVDIINIGASPKDLGLSLSRLEQISKFYSDENNRGDKSFNVPPPVYIRSSPMSVKGETQRTEDFWKRGRSVMHIDSDGIPVIHGVRMPDDEHDRETWRNARVINGILVRDEKPDIEVESDKQKITRKAIKHLEDTSTNKESNEGSKPLQSSLFLERSVEQKNQHVYPHDSDTHARILEYIDTVNQRETDWRSSASLRARMIPHSASRRSDENRNARLSSDSESQGRVLHYPGSAIHPTSLLYTPPSVKTSRVSFEEGVRTPVLQYAHPELGVQPAKVMSKQDKAEEAEGGQANTLTLAYFAHDVHSDRSPYAYEPGLQTNEDQAKVTTEESSAHTKRSSTDEDLSSQSSTKQWPEKTLAYLHDQQIPDQSYGLSNDKYIKRYPYNGYNNVYFGTNKDIQNRYKGQTAGSGYSKYPFGGGHYSSHALHTKQERPFWERVGDTIREHVQTSMEKVNDITRPVVEPLMEATHKISHNLGLASESNRNVIQDKVGSTVAAYPVLLPALGLVAGGAALGLGAVAVGRYLDVDVMKRRVGLKDEDSELQAEHKRALESIVRDLGEREAATWVVSEGYESSEGQKEALETAVRALNGGQQNRNQDNIRLRHVDVTIAGGKKRERAIADNSVERDKVEAIENVLRSLNRPKDVAAERTWMLVRSMNPREDERMKEVVDRLGVWTRVEDVKNQEDQKNKDIESIVGTLAEYDGIGHQDGSWIVADDGNEQQNGRWVLGKGDIPPEVKQPKFKRSLNDEIIVLVEEDPNFGSRERISVQGLDLSGTHLRKQRQLNKEIIVHMGQKLQEGSINFDVTEGKEHRLGKGAALKPTMNKDVTKHQLPVSSYHVISKRSTEDSHQQSDNKEDAFSRLEDGEHLDNFLHSAESRQYEILASISRSHDHRGDWSNTPCAKKIFCDVMVKQPPDALMLMEKRMATFLSL